MCIRVSQWPLVGGPRGLGSGRWLLPFQAAWPPCKGTSWTAYWLCEGKVCLPWFCATTAKTVVQILLASIFIIHICIPPWFKFRELILNGTRYKQAGKLGRSGERWWLVCPTCIEHRYPFWHIALKSRVISLYGHWMETVWECVYKYSYRKILEKKFIKTCQLMHTSLEEHFVDVWYITYLHAHLVWYY